MTEKAVSELAQMHAVLEERMNTKQAEYKTDIARLAEQMAQRDSESHKRETRIILAMFAAVALATAILGFMIRLPAPV